MANDLLFKFVVLFVCCLYQYYLSKKDRPLNYLCWGMILPIEIGITLLFSDKASRPLLFIEGMQLFLEIGVYYFILIIIHRVLRNRVKSSVLSCLWVLPNILYVFLLLRKKTVKPLLFIKIPFEYKNIIIFTWLIGAFIFSVSIVVSHFSYKQKIIKNSYLVTDEIVLGIWHKIQEEYGDRSYTLVSSCAVNSPVTIGVIPSKTVVILPEKRYSQKEYELIFRHELTHIYSADSEKKCFLMLCAACNWFNVFFVAAIRMLAVDIECSCDEIVCREFDNKTKKEYALLLLNTASISRGFTTCLISSKAVLEERIKSIFSTSYKSNGNSFVFLLLAILLLSHGLVQLIIPVNEDVLFFMNKNEIGNVKLIDPLEEGSIYYQYKEDAFYVIEELIGAEELYLTAIDLERIRTNKQIKIIFAAKDSETILNIAEHVISVFQKSESSIYHREYYSIGPIRVEEYKSKLTENERR